MNHFDGAAADQEGNVYVLNTRLDPFGLYVTGSSSSKSVRTEAANRF
ncbi:hypothetical protein LJK88_26780 [Paenibacillus sp. P26]|nr:hypothetical protein LJK88_26780 [Paenibacillus sp. P26]